MFIESGKKKNPTILLVDDDPQVLNSLVDLLRRDFHVLATDDPDEALLVLHNNGIALLISDQRMPGLTGAELFARAARISPDTIRVLLTAYSDIQAVVQAVNEGQMCFYLSKPWNPEELLRVAEGAVKRYVTVAENRDLVRQLDQLNRRITRQPAVQPAAGAAVTPAELENRTLQATRGSLHTALEHLRHIQQLIPICIHCGKGKTGSTRWEDVADYLKRHPDFLSHGYCPECYAKLSKDWGVGSANLSEHLNG